MECVWAGLGWAGVVGVMDLRLKRGLRLNMDTQYRFCAVSAYIFVQGILHAPVSLSGSEMA